MAEAVAQRLEELVSHSFQPWSDDIIDVQELLDQLRARREPWLVKTCLDHSLVHYACQKGWLHFMKYLIEEHRCDPYARTCSHLTPLHYACRYGHIDIVCYLIGVQHCDTNTFNSRRDFRWTPFRMVYDDRRRCTQEKALTIGNFLCSIAECHVDRMAEYGYTTFLLACKQGNTELARSLMAEGHSDMTTSGDTALHIACHHGRAVISKLLLMGTKINPNVKNGFGDTPLHSACRRGKSALVQLLVRNERCNPHEKNSDGDTALHVVCHRSSSHSTNEIAKLLLEETKIDPNANNNNGDTPLHLACNGQNATLVELLVRDPRCNFSEVNGSGNTPLVLNWACRHHKQLVQFLIRDERCNPHEKNSDGDTALHVVCHCSSSHSGDEVANLLLEETKIDPNANNNNGDTPLHLACNGKNATLVELLVRDPRCNFSEVNGSGSTPLVLHWACRHHKKLVQFLIRDERCNPHEKNSDGDTALHVVCRFNAAHRTSKILKRLLEKTKIDPSSKNKAGQTPLDLTSDAGMIRELIRHGANPQDVYETHGKILSKHSSNQPLQTPVKFFMVGNHSAGKSTLTKALQSEMTPFVRFVTRSKPVSGVDKKTAGIVPHDFESKTYGRVTLYDFAGQSEFYGSHAALLQNAIQTSTPMFLVVVDLSESNEDIKRNIFYWLSFLENQCTSVSSKPHFVVIGSHADILKSKREDPKRKGSLLTAQTIPQFPSLEFAGFVAMDCQYADSAGMRELHQLLKTSCDSLRSQENINFNAHCFLVYLLDKFREATALTLATIQAQIKEEFDQPDASEDDIKTFVPSSIHSLYAICVQLNDRGHLLVLKNPSAIESSWVIIDRTALLAEVNGTIFAPEGFEEHINLASNTGVVPLSNIGKYFPKHDRYMLVGFISHLEFCCEISDLETLDVISQEQGVEGERYFFFPGLVTLEVPSTVWEPQPQFDYHCGWILQCSQPEQFFGPRFLQVLLLRLAFCFAFPKLSSSKIPSLQRKCSIWKNGIYWGDKFGSEVLVEVAKQNKVVVLMRCPEVKSECLQLRFFLIQKVLAATREFCSKVSTIESFINNSDTTQYPLKPTSQLTLCVVPDIATAVAEGVPSIVHDTGKPISLDSLLSFEPYADLGEPILRHLFNKDSPMYSDRVSDVFISEIAERIPKKKEIIKALFKPKATELAKRMSKAAYVSAEYEITQILYIWRDSCEGTYQCLREKLDQFSVFAGRNPVEIAGLSCKSVLSPHKHDEAGNSSSFRDTTSSGDHSAQPIKDDDIVAPIAMVVSPDHVNALAAVLDDLAGDWYRFTGLLGLSEGKCRQIQLNSAWKPDGAKICLLDALHLWVKTDDEAATYEKVTTVLQKHFADRAVPVIKAMRKFAEEHAM